MAQKPTMQDSKTQPGLPLPPPITSDEPGTWSYDTMSRRVVEIARRTLVENLFSEEIGSRVEALISDIPEGKIRLMDRTAPDADAWNAYTQPYLDQNWLTPPWLFSETYFYRRLIEATGFYEPGPGFDLDPFLYQKEQGLLLTGDLIQQIAVRLERWIAQGYQDEHFAALVAIDLWGNRADLSMWPAGDAGEQPTDVDWEAARAHTLADDTAVAIAYLHGRPNARIDFIVDNAGLELVADLALADYLLSTATAETVYFHLKPHPTFVSDAMIRDVEATAGFLAKQDHAAVSSFGKRLQDYMVAGRLLLKDHPYWVSPLPLWQMPLDLRQDLGHSDLIISKGDANYRRLLGDRQWPYTTPFADILSYTPSSLLALRALKAELACGLTEKQIKRLNEEDPDWMVNGRWAVIQFALPGGANSDEVAGQ